MRQTSFRSSLPVVVVLAAAVALAGPAAADTGYSNLFTLDLRVPPAISSFTAGPSSITAGQSATLTWASTGGTSASIDNGVGTVATSGSKVVSPASTTTYTLTVTGAGGTATRQVTVTVTGAVTTITLTPAIRSLVAGGTGFLTVSITPAPAAKTTVTLASSNASVLKVPGSVSIVPPVAYASFEVTGSVAGPATVTATLPASLGGARATSAVTVTAATGVAEVLGALDDLDAAAQDVLNDRQGRLSETLALLYLVAAGEDGFSWATDLSKAKTQLSAVAALAKSMDKRKVDSSVYTFITGIVVDAILKNCDQALWDQMRRSLSLLSSTDLRPDPAQHNANIKVLSGLLGKDLVVDGTTIAGFDTLRSGVSGRVAKAKATVQGAGVRPGFPVSDTAAMVRKVAKAIRETSAHEGVLAYPTVLEDGSLLPGLQFRAAASDHLALAEALYVDDAAKTKATSFVSGVLAAAGIVKAVVGIAGVVVTAGTSSLIAAEGIGLTASTMGFKVGSRMAEMDRDRSAFVQMVVAVQSVASEVSFLTPLASAASGGAGARPPVVDAIASAVEAIATKPVDLGGYQFSVERVTVPDVVSAGSDGTGLVEGNVVVRNNGSRASMARALVEIQDWTGERTQTLALTENTGSVVEPGATATLWWSTFVTGASLKPSTVRTTVVFGPGLSQTVVLGGKVQLTYPGATPPPPMSTTQTSGSLTSATHGLPATAPAQSSSFVSFELAYASGTWDLHLWDTSGRHVGMDYTSGTMRNDVPEATAPVPLDNPQVIRAPVRFLQGAYRLEAWNRDVALAGTGAQARAALSMASEPVTYALTTVAEPDIPGVLVVGPQDQTVATLATDSAATAEVTVRETGRQKPLSGLTAAAGDFVGASGSRIPASAVTAKLSATTVNAGGSASLVVTVPLTGRTDFPYLGSVTVSSGGQSRVVTVRLTREMRLSGGMVSVSVLFRNQFSGESGEAKSLPQGDSFGYFYFFTPDVPEVFVKVLDFGADRPYLLFYAGLTDFEYAVTFTNVASGQSVTLRKPAGSFDGGSNTVGLPHGSMRAFLWSRDGSEVSPLPAGRTLEQAVREGCLDGRDLDDIGFAPRGFTRVATPLGAAASNELLLSQGRVAVSVTFRNQYSGESGPAVPIPQRSEFGYFYIFNAGVPEVFVKVLDFGASSPFLLFFGGLTDFEYTVTFRNVKTGKQVSFKKDAGTFNGGVDTTSLPQQ